MRRATLRLALLAGAASAAIPCLAAPERLDSSLLYVRARAAEAGGNSRAAAAQLGLLVARDPTDQTVLLRAYREALVADDPALALRAARLLDRQQALPPDGRLLLATDAIRVKAWPVARAQVDLVEKEKLFAFLAPMLRAWIAYGAHDGDPLALLEPARAMKLAEPYLAEQRALLLIALGRVEEGVTALRGAKTTDLTAVPIRIRLLAADALAATGERPRALALLDGDGSALAVGRAAIMAGKRLPAPVDDAASGAALLLVRFSSDLARQQLAPIAFSLARIAAFTAPRDSSGWLLVASLLGTMKRPADALAALDHVDPADPIAQEARTLKVSLLADKGDQAAALAEARRGAPTDVAGLARIGDVSLALSRPAEAADAYRRAIAAAEAAKTPSDQVWPLYLQLGAALDGAGDWPAARAALEQAGRLAPEQALVLNQLGYSKIAHREDMDRASAMILHASSLRPDDPAITDSLGWSEYLRGCAADAVPILERASAAAPAEPTINEHLGDAYWATGRIYEARYAWRAALVTSEDKDKARLSAKIDTGLTPATASP